MDALIEYPVQLSVQRVFVNRSVGTEGRLDYRNDTTQWLRRHGRSRYLLAIQLVVSNVSRSSIDNSRFRRGAVGS